MTRHADAIKDRLAKNYELLGDLYSRVPEGQRHLQVQINNIVANEKKVAGVADEMKDYADKFLHGEVVIKNDALAILK